MMTTLTDDQTSQVMHALKGALGDLIELLGEPELSSPPPGDSGGHHLIIWRQVPGWAWAAFEGGWVEHLFWTLLPMVGDARARRLATLPRVALPPGVVHQPASDFKVAVWCGG
jgi:hypothetical protein